MKFKILLAVLLLSIFANANELKIIAVEEHLLDPTIAKASRENTLKQAPYAFNWGVRVQEKNALSDTSRPRILSAKEAFAKTFESTQARLNSMDKAGIDMQILSFGGAPQLVPNDQLDLILLANDRLSQMIKQNPQRFAGFATLPWQNPDVALIELERAVKVLNLNGVLINGRPSDAWLDDARYEKILAKLNELKVPLFIHPGLPHADVQKAYYSGFDDEIMARFSLFGWGWHNEAGVAVLRLILSGAFDRYPNLQIISGHWGEMVPFFLARLDDSFPREVTGLKRSVSQTYREHVFVTPSGMLQNEHFEFIYKVMGADRIIFSVDYPFLSLNGARKWLENLPISQDEKKKIAYKNVQKLMKIK